MGRDLMGTVRCVTRPSGLRRSRPRMERGLLRLCGAKCEDLQVHGLGEVHGVMETSAVRVQCSIGRAVMLGGASHGSCLTADLSKKSINDIFFAPTPVKKKPKMTYSVPTAVKRSNA